MTKTQKLGRGLGELLGEIGEAYDNEVSSKDVVVELNLKDIKPNPYQPRKEFDEVALQELSESIKRDGLIQPVVVSEKLDGYVLIAGERRLRASKLAKLKTIKAVIINSDEQKMREFALLENIQREDLNPIELAYAYEELIKLHDITHEELSNIIHKSRTHISNTLRLLNLSKKTQDALVFKKITAGHAKVLVGLDEKQQQLIVNSIIGQKLSVREVETMIKDIKIKKQFQKEQKETQICDFSAIKNHFSKLGIKIRSSKNKLTIEFKNQQEVEKLLSKIV